MEPNNLETVFFAKETQSTAFIWAVLFGVAERIKHGTVTVRTKALIIHFPLELPPC